MLGHQRPCGGHSPVLPLQILPRASGAVEGFACCCCHLGIRLFERGLRLFEFHLALLLQDSSLLL